MLGKVLGVLGFLLLGIVLAMPASGASFDCGKARTPFAKAVCSHPDLSKADDGVAAALRDALNGLSEPAKAEVTKAQNAWVQYANIACTPEAKPLTKPYGDDAIQCLQSLFEARTSQLKNSKTIGGLRFYYIDRYAALADPDRDQDGSPSDTAAANKDTSVPRIDGTDPEAIAFNHFIDVTARTALDLTITDHPGPDAGNQDDSNGMIVTRVTDALITLALNVYTYGHGAAHGNYATTYIHYLRGEKRTVAAADVFGDPDWQAKLKPIALKAVKKQMGEDLMLDDPSSIDALVVDPAHWDFSDKGLILQFEPYDIAAYAVGAPTVLIPWSDLNGLLSKTVGLLQK